MKHRTVSKVLRPSGAQIDILIVNCSLFNPTPSLTAMIVNHFKMRSDVNSYNLGGMGCSAGVIAVGLAKELLQVTLRQHPDPLVRPLAAASAGHGGLYPRRL